MGKSRGRRRKQKKTRKLRRKQKGGGGLLMLPLSTNPRILEIVKIPKGMPYYTWSQSLYSTKNTNSTHNDLMKVIQDTKKELERDWEFKLIAAHGAIPLGQPVPVPENTYVIFGAPAGSVLTSYGPHDPNFSSTKSEFLENLASDHVYGKGNFTRGTTNIEELKAAGCFTDEFYNTGERKIKFKDLPSCQKQLTIYGPGEPMLNMALSFKSSDYLFLLGVYDLPLEEDFGRSILYSSVRREQFGDRSPIPDKELFARPPNLHPEYIGTSKTLDEVMRELPPVEEGKKRLLFIQACRGIYCSNPERHKTLTFAARRASIDPSTMENFLRAFDEAEERGAAGGAVGGAESVAGGAGGAAGRASLPVDKARVRAGLKHIFKKGPPVEPPLNANEFKMITEEINRQGEKLKSMLRRLIEIRGNYNLLPTMGDDVLFRGGPLADTE